VTEELAFEKAVGDGDAIELYERQAFAAAVIVDGLRNELFAGTALSDDQDGNVGVGDFLDDFKNFLHRAAAADDILEIVLFVEPPLRDRKDDIPMLAEHFIRLGNSKFRRQMEGLTPDALGMLMNYDWPGNVRVQNYIERAIVLSDEIVLGPSCFPPQITHQDRSEGATPVDTEDRSLKDVMGDLEKQIVMDALSKTSGVQVRAAKHLGITERSLWHLVKKHSIEVEKFK